MVVQTLACYQLSTSSQPGLAVIADKNPYLVLNPDSTRPAYQQTSQPGEPFSANRWGNSANHDSDGQNVLFCNGSVSFQSVPYCGVNNDNIYTMATTALPQIGSLPYSCPSPNYLFTKSTPLFAGATQMELKPMSASDSILINEGAKQGGVNPIPAPPGGGVGGGYGG